MTLAGALEQAAGTIARLDAALASHPLRPAWAWRARLDAIRRQAAVDGKAIDPWHLAALIEGVRLRLDHTPVLIDRGMLFAAAHHAFELYRWFAVPDETQRAAIRLAADHLETVGTAQSPLLGAALGVHAWLDQGGARPPLRAAAAARGPRIILAAVQRDRPALPAVDRCRSTRRRHSVAADEWTHRRGGRPSVVAVLRHALGFALRVEFVDLGRENAESDLRRISVTFAPFCEFIPISQEQTH